MEYEGKPPTFCDDLQKFMTTFISTTAEAIQTTQGSGGLMIMSVAIGTKLWDEIASFADCTMPKFETKEEKINCFMNTLKKSGAIGAYSIAYRDDLVKMEIHDCFLSRASDKQMEEGLEFPLCPIGGIIVAGLHKTAHILATLEKVERFPKEKVSRLTFRLY